MKRVFLALIAVATVACTTVARPPRTSLPIPTPTANDAYLKAVEADCNAVYQDELGRPADPEGLNGCRALALANTPDWQGKVREYVRSLEEYRSKQTPPANKAEFQALIRANQYQANFGTIKLPGLGLHMDALFDPFLLIKWAEDHAAFEVMMQAHMGRGDNVVYVDPRSGYHGHNDVDMWHEPARFAEFLKDVRSHKNKYGEQIRVHVFMGGDSHIDSMLAPGAFEHWKSDVAALKAAAEDQIDSTVPCWECRHDPTYGQYGPPWVSAKLYIEMGKYLAQMFPNAVHAQHLISNSSSWSAWRCDPLTGPCDSPVSPYDADDPNRGSEAGAWENCTKEGWCDLFLFQFDIGNSYLYPDTEPNYTGFGGALGRWFEVVVRMANDERARALSGGDRHGWVQTDVIASEFIYDTYWMRDPKATEQYAVEFCKRALAMGGRGCGSASYRLGQ